MDLITHAKHVPRQKYFKGEKGTNRMSHTIPFMGDKTFLCIYAHNENQRASVEKIRATAVGYTLKYFQKRME